MRPEILAPVGSPEALTAALRCGADAVYLALPAYGARAHAQNFSFPALEAAIAACHARAVRVYVTLNTLLLDAELGDFMDAVQRLCALSVDAVIVQDLGAARLIHQLAPTLPLHASTQMSVQTLAGLETLAALGFSRAVLPRELSREELRTLVRHSPIDCEVFVHGALCTSVSGQCLLSSFFGGRSANRGDCAQPCRLPFSGTQENGSDQVLSLKDLSIMDALPELAAAGVRSLKIEGRMKRPEYVAAAVRVCRQALDNVGARHDVPLPVHTTGNQQKNLHAVFSRSGFTAGYYYAQRDSTMQGARTREDVTAARDALPALAALYAKESPRTGVTFTLSGGLGEGLYLCAETDAHAVSLAENTPLQRANNVQNSARLQEQLAKCGGTMFFCRAANVQLPPNVYVPVASVNALRRQALCALEEKMAARVPIACAPYEKVSLPPRVPTAQSLQLRVATLKQVPQDLRGVSQIIVPLSVAKHTPPRAGTNCVWAVEIPRGVCGQERTLLADLRAAQAQGYTRAIVGTLDGAALAKRAGLAFAAGFGSNICNSACLHAWQALGAAEVLLSPELTRVQASRIHSPLPTAWFAYGRLPLMLLRRKGYGAQLFDRKGKAFPLVEVGGDYTELLACTPVSLAGRGDECRFADALLLYFTDETAAQCQAVLQAFRADRASGISGESCRGLPGWTVQGGASP
ncbi:MAG: U32 family peptidase [Oscillospiraceae bacterium]|jgi:putative protease|nr:U32 family peptidase [Oscillospiraceae bacterium]